MPENTQPRPDFLTKLASYNAINGVHATFSEMKKTAQRIGKAWDNRADPSELDNLDDFIHRIYSDPTGETAVKHILDPESCDHHPSIERRLARLAA